MKTNDGWRISDDEDNGCSIDIEELIKALRLQLIMISLYYLTNLA